jgi:hypothetical protein
LDEKILNRKSRSFAALRACPELESAAQTDREQILRCAQDDRGKSEGMTERAKGMTNTVALLG